jgi:formylglycine-generating enzyme required for sulfatase activity
LPAEEAADRSYRLPSEAEWEYACRAGTMTRYFFGNDDAGEGLLRDYAWYYDNSFHERLQIFGPHPVGEKKPNAWGLYDMYGNEPEWCADRYQQNYYQNSPKEDPKGPAAGVLHVARGGHHNNDAFKCRSAFREGSTYPDIASEGIRVVCAIGKRDPNRKPSDHNSGTTP